MTVSVNAKTISSMRIPREPLINMVVVSSIQRFKASMRAALSVLAQYPGKKIYVMGDMFELGKRRLYCMNRLVNKPRNWASIF